MLSSKKVVKKLANWLVFFSSGQQGEQQTTGRGGGRAK
jgi:hypothetical protein